MCAAVTCADEAADRTAIERVVAELNEPWPASDAKPLSGLFTSDAASAEIDRLVNLIRQLREEAARPWSEITPPHWRVRSIRFVAPGQAIVDGAATQYGSHVATWRISLSFLMRKEGANWRIFSAWLGCHPQLVSRP